LVQGLHGIEGDGDVYRPENIKEFTHFVLSQTEGKGVHFMMADGVSTNHFLKQNRIF
jgi:cap1 methyltransferase